MYRFDKMTLKIGQEEEEYLSPSRPHKTNVGMVEPT